MTDSVPLVVHGINWSRRHGHPIILLRGIGTDGRCAVAADDDEARVFSTRDCIAHRTRKRFARLASQLLRAAGAAIDTIRLAVDTDGILRARIGVRGPRGHAVEAAALDALLLADDWGTVPTMERRELGRLAAQPEPPASQATGERGQGYLGVLWERLAELEQRDILDESS